MAIENQGGKQTVDQQEKIDKVGVQGANGDSAEASQHMLTELHNRSIARDNKDTKIDKDAEAGDKTSKKVARDTNVKTDELLQYIQNGGTFKDTQGQQLAKEMIGQLRKSSDDNNDDRKTDLQYAGSNPLSAGAQEAALKNSRAIGSAAEELATTTDPARRAELMQQIGQSAEALRTGLGDNNKGAGKDQKDAAQEAKVISADLAALQANPSPEVAQALIKNIGSKAGLIEREISDIRNEQGYAKRDLTDSKLNGDIEAVLKTVMAGGSPQAIEQLRGMLAQSKQSKNATMDNRDDDLGREPKYEAANTADVAANTKLLQALGAPIYPEKEKK